MQFLVQAWRLFALLGGALAVAIFIIWRNRNKKTRDIQEKKQNLSGNKSNEPRKKSNKSGNRRKPRPTPVADEDFAPSQGGSIFDDEDLFPDDDFDDRVAASIATHDDDPLADLYAAREEDRNEQTAQSTMTEPEEDSVDLASLLTGMVAEPIAPKDYHLIADKPVAVKLVTKKKAIAQELLTILRDDRDGRLMVQIGDVAYRTLQNDRSAKQQFAIIMQQLSGLILTPDANAPDDANITGYQPNIMQAKSIDVKISSGGDTQAREMISILRDETDAHLIIQIGNTGYRTLANHEKAKAGFSKIMKELSQAVTTPDDNPPAVPQKQKPMPSSYTPSSVYDDNDDDNDVVLPGDIRLPSLNDLPDSYKVGRFGRVQVKKVRAEDKVKPINIAEAIEEYLQYKISLSPAYQNRGIHIRSALSGGVIIEVDGQRYEFIDEVTDKDAQAFIKQAIDEWQDRH
ncbi:MAG: hypothetical protein WBC91_16320 [Phototrophicaceae bacterium]